jgi:hypothetical protein
MERVIMARSVNPVDATVATNSIDSGHVLIANSDQEGAKLQVLRDVTTRILVIRGARAMTINQESIFNP